MHEQYQNLNGRQLDNPETIRMHIEILGKREGMEIDHKDCDGLNNQRCNLRHCTIQQNQHNRIAQSNSITGYKGVGFKKGINKFRARISLKKIQMHLGYFDTPQEAHLAYKSAASKYHGEFAHV